MANSVCTDHLCRCVKIALLFSKDLEKIIPAAKTTVSAPFCDRSDKYIDGTLMLPGINFLLEAIRAAVRFHFSLAAPSALGKRKKTKKKNDIYSMCELKVDLGNKHSIWSPQVALGS